MFLSQDNLNWGIEYKHHQYLFQNKLINRINCHFKTILNQSIKFHLQTMAYILWSNRLCYRKKRVKPRCALQKKDFQHSRAALSSLINRSLLGFCDSLWVFFVRVRVNLQQIPTHFIVIGTVLQTGYDILQVCKYILISNCIYFVLWNINIKKKLWCKKSIYKTPVF